MSRRLALDAGVVLYMVVTAGWLAVLMYVLFNSAISSSPPTDEDLLVLSVVNSVWFVAQVLAWAVFFADLSRRDIRTKVPWGLGFVFGGAFVIPIYYAVHIRAALPRKRLHP